LEKIPGSLILTTSYASTDEDNKVELPIEIDFKEKIISSATGQAQDLKIKAMEACDSGEPCFFIFQPDVTFLRHEDPNCGERTYVQAKLSVIGIEDNNSNGLGVVESSVVLYNICETIRENKGEREDTRKTNISTGKPSQGK